MDITSSTVVVELSARARATQSGASGITTIGDRIALSMDCEVAYSFRVSSSANGQVATLNCDNGIVNQTTGTPAIADGDGNDIEGKDNGLGVGSAQLALLVVADDENAGTVACVGSDLAECPSATLRAGGFALLCQPAATAVGAGSTLTMTFNGTSNAVTVYVLSRIAA
jgi:hypothetical protein